MNEAVYHEDYQTGQIVVRHKDEVLVDFENVGRLWINKSECKLPREDYGFYFAYGSNLHIPQMMARCKDAVAVTQGILADHQLLYRNGVATVEPKKGSKVLGAIYKISHRDLKALDIYEGYPRLYYREHVEIETKRGVMECMLYKMHTTYGKCPPGNYYLNTIKEGYLQWGLPVKQLPTK